MTISKANREALADTESETMEDEWKLLLNRK